MTVDGGCLMLLITVITIPSKNKYQIVENLLFLGSKWKLKVYFNILVTLQLILMWNFEKWCCFSHVCKSRFARKLMKITTSQVITYLPEISGSISQVKSVLLKHRKATINKKITAGDVIYFLRGCHRYFVQCVIENFMKNNSENWLFIRL